MQPGNLYGKKSTKRIVTNCYGTITATEAGFYTVETVYGNYSGVPSVVGRCAIGDQVLLLFGDPENLRHPVIISNSSIILSSEDRKPSFIFRWVENQGDESKQTFGLVNTSYPDYLAGRQTKGGPLIGLTVIQNASSLIPDDLDLFVVATASLKVYHLLAPTIEVSPGLFGWTLSENQSFTLMGTQAGTSGLGTQRTKMITGCNFYDADAKILTVIPEVTFQSIQQSSSVNRSQKVITYKLVAGILQTGVESLIVQQWQGSLTAASMHGDSMIILSGDRGRSDNINGGTVSNPLLVPFFNIANKSRIKGLKRTDSTWAFLWEFLTNTVFSTINGGGPYPVIWAVGNGSYFQTILTPANTNWTNTWEHLGFPGSVRNFSPVYCDSKFRLTIAAYLLDKISSASGAGTPFDGVGAIRSMSVAPGEAFVSKLLDVSVDPIIGAHTTNTIRTWTTPTSLVQTAVTADWGSSFAAPAFAADTSEPTLSKVWESDAKTTARILGNPESYTPFEGWPTALDRWVGVPIPLPCDLPNEQTILSGGALVQRAVGTVHCIRPFTTTSAISHDGCRVALGKATWEAVAYPEVPVTLPGVLVTSYGQSDNPTGESGSAFLASSVNKYYKFGWHQPNIVSAYRTMIIYSPAPGVYIEVPISSSFSGSVYGRAAVFEQTLSESLPVIDQVWQLIPVEALGLLLILRSNRTDVKTYYPTIEARQLTNPAVSVWEYADIIDRTLLASSITRSSQIACEAGENAWTMGSFAFNSIFSRPAMKLIKEPNRHILLVSAECFQKQVSNSSMPTRVEYRALEITATGFTIVESVTSNQTSTLNSDVRLMNFANAGVVIPRPHELMAMGIGNDTTYLNWTDFVKVL